MLGISTLHFTVLDRHTLTLLPQPCRSHSQMLELSKMDIYLVWPLKQLACSMYVRQQCSEFHGQLFGEDMLSKLCTEEHMELVYLLQLTNMSMSISGCSGSSKIAIPDPALRENTDSGTQPRGHYLSRSDTWEKETRHGDTLVFCWPVSFQGYQTHSALWGTWGVWGQFGSWIGSTDWPCTLESENRTGLVLTLHEGPMHGADLRHTSSNTSQMIKCT